jgi:hypothetical protein
MKSLRILSSSLTRNQAENKPWSWHPVGSSGHNRLKHRKLRLELLHPLLPPSHCHV